MYVSLLIKVISNEKSIEKRKLDMPHREGFLRVNMCILYLQYIHLDEEYGHVHKY